MAALRALLLPLPTPRCTLDPLAHRPCVALTRRFSFATNQRHLDIAIGQQTERPIASTLTWDTAAATAKRRVRARCKPAARIRRFADIPRRQPTRMEPLSRWRADRASAQMPRSDADGSSRDAVVAPAVGVADAGGRFPGVHVSSCQPPAVWTFVIGGCSVSSMSDVGPQAPRVGAEPPAERGPLPPTAPPLRASSGGVG